MTTRLLSALALPAMILLAQTAGAQAEPADTPMPRTTATQPSLDNTENNRMNRAGALPTADQQKNDARDLDMTQQIRRSVMGDKTLSMAAHNVKIVSEGGHVTLRGVVRSDSEKSAIADKAMAVAGRDRVVNELQLESK